MACPIPACRVRGAGGRRRGRRCQRRRLRRHPDQGAFRRGFVPGGRGRALRGPSPHEEGTQSGFAFDGDINGDRFSDAASTSNGQTGILVTPGSASGFTPDFQTVPLPGGFPFVVMTDVNGDGYSDLALSLEFPTGAVALFAGSPAGLSATPFLTGSRRPAQAAPSSRSVRAISTVTAGPTS